MTKKRFTLLEMLLVMAIIAILAAILIPLISRVKNTAKVRQASSDINGTKMAIDAFYNDYGALPLDGTLEDQVFLGSIEGADKVKASTVGPEPGFTDSTNTKGVITSPTICRKMYTILQMPCDYSQGYKCEAYKIVLKRNPNQNRYLPFTYTKWEVTDCSNNDNWAKHKLLKAYDPWDRPYLFYLDGDADGQIEVHPSFKLDGNILNNHVGIVSLGGRLKGTVEEILNKKQDVITSW